MRTHIDAVCLCLHIYACIKKTIEIVYMGVRVEEFGEVSLRKYCSFVSSK
jgi:hypothetical protein